MTIQFDDDRIEQIDLGSHIIKESMAALYQSLVDADAEHNDVPSVDVLELIAQEAMFSYMTRPKDDKICPLYYMCSGSEYDKDGCIGALWEEPLCSFTIVSSSFSLNEKTIT